MLAGAGALAVAVGDLLLGALVAPHLFHHLPRPEAGRIFGPLLAHWTALAWLAVAPATVALVLAALQAARVRRPAAIVPVVLALALAGAHGWADQRARHGQDLLAAMPALPAAEPSAQALAADAQARFQAFHRGARLAFQIAAATALLTAVAAGIAVLKTVPAATREQP
jgi:hypothetical protein